MYRCRVGSPWSKGGGGGGGGKGAFLKISIVVFVQKSQRVKRSQVKGIQCT